MKIAVFSAFPQEIRLIIKEFGAKKCPGQRPFTAFLARSPSHEILLVEAGVGSRNAETALSRVFKEFGPDYVVSAGFGGALYDGALIGELTWAPKVLFLSANGLEILEIPDAGAVAERLSGKVALLEKCVLSLDSWMKKSGIRKILPPDLPPLVCDMETFPLAKLSIQEGVPFFAIRSITDLADEEIPPELLTVCDAAGNYSLLRALRLLCRKPALIPNIARLGGNSYHASKNLLLAVNSLIEIL